MYAALPTPRLRRIDSTPLRSRSERIRAPPDARSRANAPRLDLAARGCRAREARAPDWNVATRASSVAQVTSTSSRVVLVTGSVRGLGLAVARAFAERGERVHVVWRGSSDLAASRAAEFPSRVHRSDLADEGSAQELVRAVVARDGRLDVLVHAVGEYLHGPLERASAADLRRMLASNVETSFALMNAAREPLRAARGCALFFGCAGLEGARAKRDTAVYSAAKTALLVLVRSWALAEAAHGVRVNMLSPGLVPHAHAADDTLDPALQAAIPLGRPGRPADIARAAWFLASGDAEHVTGIDLPVTGGWQG